MLKKRKKTKKSNPKIAFFCAKKQKPKLVRENPRKSQFLQLLPGFGMEPRGQAKTPLT